MNPELEFARKTALAYNVICKPLCQELNLPQTAFDILMFLGNNPEYRTARDIVEVRNIKANLVSVNVDRLVQEGYLERRSVAMDRRKTELICTEKAKSLMEEGRAMQQAFWEKLFDGMDQEARKAFMKTLDSIGKNAEEILKGEY